MSIRQAFLDSLLRQLTRHLHHANHRRFGTQLYILPLNWDTMMKIRLTLSWIEGHRVFHLDYWGVLKVFKRYCREHYPIEYNKKRQRYVVYLLTN